MLEMRTGMTHDHELRHAELGKDFSLRCQWILNGPRVWKSMSTKAEEVNSTVLKPALKSAPHPSCR